MFDMSHFLQMFAKSLGFHTAEGVLDKKKTKQNNSNLSPPHCSGRDKSSVPFNTKGRQSKTEEDSLTVWGRLVAHNRCYSLINNSVCQGWAWAPHPSEALCVNFGPHKINELAADDVMGKEW